MSRTDPTKFFFVHLHKTAGTSLWSRLSHQFSADQMYPSSHDGSPLRRTVAVDDLVARWPARRDEVRVLAGHFPLCVREMLGDEFVTFTLLRDPVDRVLSALKELRQKVPEFADRPFVDIYFDPLRHTMLSNHMVKMFSMTREEESDGLLTPLEVGAWSVDRALVGLDSCDAVGFQHEFEPFCDSISARYGWDLGEPVIINASEPAAMPPELVEVVTDDNALDLAFYAEALHRYERGTGEPAIRR